MLYPNFGAEVRRRTKKHGENYAYLKTKEVWVSMIYTRLINLVMLVKHCWRLLYDHGSLCVWVF
jgi:hypothetical protein